MRKIVSLIAILTIVISAFGQIYEPVKWTFKINATSDKTAVIQLRASIDNGWHLYGMDIPTGGPKATTIVFENIENAVKVGDVQAISKLHKAHDANFDMDINWYVTEAVFVQKIKFNDASKVKIKGLVEFMSCNDESCLPPQKIPFKLGIPVSKTDTIAKAQPPTTVSTNDYWKPVINELKNFGSTEKSNDSISLWLIFLAGLIGGFLAFFTPCVWPIIPMTVSFFLKRSDNKKRGRRDAILYGLAIIFIYVTLGILITLLFGASALNSLSTNAVFNLIFFALLVVFWHYLRLVFGQLYQ